MYTKIKCEITKKRFVEIGRYEDAKYLPYVVRYWSHKTTHMYAKSFNTYEEAEKEFKRIVNKN